MKTYYLKFGSGDPALFSGLSPTMTVFSAGGFTAVTAPGITESVSDPGIYVFYYGPTTSIIFKADGGSGLASGDRYISGALDPLQAVDEKIGTIQDSFGSTSIDPSTVLGYLKRLQEWNEGNAIFTKATGIWQVFTRGSSVMIASKALTNTTTNANKS